MLYVVMIGMTIFFIINYFLFKNLNLKHGLYTLILFLVLNYLSYKNSFLKFDWLQCLLFVISFLSIFSVYNRKKKYFVILLFLLCSFYSEFFVFNFRHFTTFFYKEHIIKDYDIVHEQSDDQKLSFIKINNINTNVYNIYLNIKSKTDNIILPIEVKGTDEGNKNLYSLHTHKYITTISKSHYFYTHFYGKTKDIVLDVTSLGKKIKIRKISINKDVPLFFNYLRFLLCFVLCCLIYVIRPNSCFYKYKLLNKIRYKKFIFIIYILLCIILFFCLTNINPYFSQKGLDSYNEYYDLTESLLDGHFYLNEKVPKVLKNMENPYDYKERTRIFVENGLDARYKWDYSYYKGKFYVYFGVLPALVLFLPFYVLFHTHLLLHYAVLILLIFGSISILYFVYELCKKYFPKVSLISYFLGVIILTLMCGFVYIGHRPDLYSIPIVFAIGLTFLGLGFWLDASMSLKRKKRKLFLGSLCIALISACRPQFLISAILFYPIFKEDLYHKPWDKKNIILFLIPFFMIGISMMYYNYARFGSVFEFGANYNLTTNDMIHRGFNFDRIGFGFFTYLLQPVNIVQTFPYIQINNMQNNYLGNTIIESWIGGFFFSTSIALIGFYLIKHKKVFHKNILTMSCMCYICAVIIILFDIEMAGVLPRYIADFAWAFLIPAICVLFYFDSLEIVEKRILFRKILLTLLLFSSLYQFFVVFIYPDLSFEKCSPDIFHAVRYFIEFWL